MTNWLIMIAALLGICLTVGAESDWLEVCTPGKDVVGLSESGDSDLEKAVVDLVPFADRLFIRLENPEKKEGEEPKKIPILSLNPDKLTVKEEVLTVGSGFGRFRVIKGKLYVPIKSPVGAESGYYVWDGKGTWLFVKVAGDGSEFNDIAQFDGKTFLAGSLKGQAIAYWRKNGEETWHPIPLNQQASRWSYEAEGFLQSDEHLSLLVLRDVIGEWPVRCAPREWGAWYLLHYYPKKSVRHFLFDGKPYPLPVLEKLGPGCGFRNNHRYQLSCDVPWRKGVLYLFLGRNGRVRDPKGGLFYAEIEDSAPQVGRSFVGERLPGLEYARDAVVNEKGECEVLLAEDAKKHGKIVVSKDLKNWRTLYEGELPGIPVCMAVVDKSVFIGLSDGTVIMKAR